MKGTPGIRRFAKLLIARRSQHGPTAANPELTLMEIISRGVKGWHGIKLNQPDWSDQSHNVALSVVMPNEAIQVF